jgi:sarcosine oxidase
VRVIVVGAGAWGLPAAAELARRGHAVTIVDQHGVGNALGSSGGASRIWRLSHPDALMVRLAERSVDAWRDVERRTGRELLLRRGLLWRAGNVGAVAQALAGEGVVHVEVPAADVGRWFPGLRPDGVDALWQQDAGVVLAAASLDAHLGLLRDAGGALRTGDRVSGVDTDDRGVRLTLSSGERLDADVAVLAPGPWAAPLLRELGLTLDLGPVLEQVAYVTGRPGWEDLPCLYEGERGGEPGMYAMPTPGIGYKIGIDLPLRGFRADEDARAPDPARDAEVEARVARDLGALEPRVLSSQVCTWTESPDGGFVVDRLLDGRVVLACGDSGAGFKFSALMGQVLADLAEDRTVDADVAALGLARFAYGSGSRRVGSR